MHLSHQVFKTHFSSTLLRKQEILLLLLLATESQNITHMRTKLILKNCISIKKTLFVSPIPVINIKLGEEGRRWNYNFILLFRKLKKTPRFGGCSWLVTNTGSLNEIACSFRVNLMRNRCSKLATWRSFIPIIFIRTVAVLRELRLPCVAVHWRSCKQNNWHFSVREVFVHFCCFSATFSQVSDFANICSWTHLGYNYAQIYQILFKLQPLWVKRSTFIVPPLCYKNQSSDWILKFSLLLMVLLCFL